MTTTMSSRTPSFSLRRDSPSFFLKKKQNDLYRRSLNWYLSMHLVFQVIGSCRDYSRKKYQIDPTEKERERGRELERERRPVRDSSIETEWRDRGTFFLKMRDDSLSSLEREIENIL